MKKYGSLIALTIVVLLAILVVITRDDPTTTIKAPYSIAKVEQLNRIELTQPGEDGKLVVLEKSGDGWNITKPIESPVAERTATRLDEELATKINSDDITLSGDKLEEFGLSDDQATKVSLFPQGANSPVAEFWVGKTISVEGTRAKRTYIKTSDGKVYRAHTELGEVLGTPLDDMRSKTVQKMDRAALDNIWVKYGEEELHLIKDGDEWKLKKPQVDFDLEKSQVNTLVNSVSNLVARGFADDKAPADVGLDPAYAEVVARESGGEPKTLLVSKPPEDGSAYVKTRRGTHIYEIAETTAKSLTPTTLSLRSRIAKPINKDDVVRIEFGGEDRVAVARKDGAWTFARGARGTVKELALEPKLTALAQLRAVRYEPVSAQEAGLDKPDERAVVKTAEATHTLLIGGEADEKGNLWAKWADSDLVMVVPQWIKERATPAASELTEDES